MVLGVPIFKHFRVTLILLNVSFHLKFSKFIYYSIIMELSENVPIVVQFHFNVPYAD